MNVGDMILCRREYTGVIIKMRLTPICQGSSLIEDGTWAQILWCHNGRMTWEDMGCSFEGEVFEVINEDW
jgi:hypothetical protein